MMRGYSLLVILCCYLFIVVPSWGADIGQQCDAYIAKITAQIQAKQYIDAIDTAADYAMTLRSFYPVPTYRDGIFRCAAHSFSFINPVGGMQLNNNADDLSAQEESDLTSVAYLCDIKEDKMLYVMHEYNNYPATDAGDSSTLKSDTAIKLTINEMGRKIGLQPDGEFITAGPYRIFIAKVMKSGLATPFWYVGLAHENSILYFMYNNVNATAEQSKSDLHQLAASVRWDYQPPDIAHIAAIRKQHHGSISQTLLCSRQLALIGEFDSAAIDIVGLRSVIAAKLPQPYIRNKYAFLPAYQVSLRNPNSTVWELSVERNDNNDLINLYDATAVIPRSMFIGVSGLHLMYRSNYLRKMNGGSEAEAIKKSIVETVGHAASQRDGFGKIHSARLTTIKGFIAYEVVADNTDNKSCLKYIVLITSNAMIHIIFHIPKYSFEKDVAQLDAIMANYLSIR